MIQTKSNLVIGVDGGGSNCRLALDAGGRLYEVKCGSANVSTDLEGALTTLRNGLESLAQSAGMALNDLRDARAYVGLAGVVSPAIAATVAEALPFNTVLVEDDRIAAVAGALGSDDGAVIGVGTGSFLGRRVSGRIELIGGWGFILGDEASGAVLGRKLLSRALHVADGLTPVSPLTADILDQMNGPAGIVEFASGAKPVDFARFAPRIVTAAKEGDAVANALLQEGAAYFMSGLDRLGWQAGERLCLIGGLAQAYGAFLPDSVAGSLSAPDDTALAGALSLARRLPETGGPP
ncbi:BadF/BadG/BcrA/BcrD ATPase family protein [Nioella ostreopsis]|uniref:BadF/BadG/BcrA/BcrD ATPase family protein n=1 Tax=Nioella ostreopsis TaxID=2448479 RepID=UPI000FD96E1E|nr:BadF/BadG/BcrA/BcrD ATPase family protein [Nioella ostreopsis]